MSRSERFPRRGGSRTAVLVSALVLLVLATALPSWGASPDGLWHMDDASVMTDGSGNGNDGDPTDIKLSSPGFGGSGSAYAFNGTSSYVIVPHDASLTPGSADVSMTVHVKFSTVPDDTVGDYDLLRKKQGAVQYKMEILRGGRPYCIFGGDVGKRGLIMRRNLADGAWHTFTCTKTASTISMTVDGATKTRTVTIGAISPTANVIIGGKEGSSGDWYAGLMDEVSVTIG